MDIFENMQNMVLAATAEGLRAYWVTASLRRRLKKCLRYRAIIV